MIMNYEVKKAILDKIKEYDRIFLFRHIRNDGDCVGATKGFKEIIKATGPIRKYTLSTRSLQSILNLWVPRTSPLKKAPTKAPLV